MIDTELVLLYLKFLMLTLHLTPHCRPSRFHSMFVLLYEREKAEEESVDMGGVVRAGLGLEL